MCRWNLHVRRIQLYAFCCIQAQWTLISLNHFKEMFQKKSYLPKSSLFRSSSVSLTTQRDLIMESSSPGMVKKFLGDFPLKSRHDDRGIYLVSIDSSWMIFLLSSSWSVAYFLLTFLCMSLYKPVAGMK